MRHYHNRCDCVLECNYSLLRANLPQLWNITVDFNSMFVNVQNITAVLRWQKYHDTQLLTCYNIYITCLIAKTSTVIHR